MSMQMFVQIYEEDVKLFHWISEWFDLLAALDGKSVDDQGHYNLSPGTLNICSKFHINPDLNIHFITPF